MHVRVREYACSRRLVGRFPCGRDRGPEEGVHAHVLALEARLADVAAGEPRHDAAARALSVSKAASMPSLNALIVLILLMFGFLSGLVGVVVFWLVLFCLRNSEPQGPAREPKRSELNSSIAGEPCEFHSSFSCQRSTPRRAGAGPDSAALVAGDRMPPRL